MSPHGAGPAPTPAVAVGAVVIDEGRLLLVRRGRAPARGYWSVPGGKVEPGETLAEAVEREVREETALEVVCGPFVGWVERRGPGYHYVIMDFRADLDGPGADPVAGDDADRVDWIALDELDGVELVDGLREFLAEHDIIG